MEIRLHLGTHSTKVPTERWWNRGDLLLITARGAGRAGVPQSYRSGPCDIGDIRPQVKEVFRALFLESHIMSGCD